MNTIVVDSGSTKAHWKFCSRGTVLLSVDSAGFNPFLENGTSMLQVLQKEVLPYSDGSYVKEGGKLFFYGAGCSTDERIKQVENVLKKSFDNWNIFVEHDLSGAARALYGDKPGVAAILGTGSNSCYYDGQEVVKNIRSLGYILGDEGSGCAIGKSFLKAVLHNSLPTRVVDKAKAELNLDIDEILDAVYIRPYPNRYMAGFTKYIKENVSEPALVAIVESAFERFFDLYLCKYAKVKETGVAFVGSVAHHFEEQLKSVAQKKSIRIGKILASPIDALVEYHLRN